MVAIQIIDIIDHKNKYFSQRFLVLNRKPNFLYERDGIWLIGEDYGFFNFYKYDKPSGCFYAFAGRKFDIPMKDGTIEKAYGQWWHATPKDYNELVLGTAYGTPNSLLDCYVFIACSVDIEIINEWLSKNEPSNNYYKYDKRHKDFGKHIIDSQWNNQTHTSMSQ